MPFHSSFHCYMFRMMTRGEVARRLGKSIATVRRMEGSVLHPRRDEQGVLRFSSEEVERVARGMRGGTPGALPPSALRSAWFDSDDEEETLDPEEIEHRERMRKREAESNAAAEAQRLERLRAEQEDERRAAEELYERQSRTVRQLTDLCELIDSCSARELRMLSRDPEFSSLMKTLEWGW